jgi:hypothetical protein
MISQAPTARRAGDGTGDPHSRCSRSKWLRAISVRVSWMNIVKIVEMETLDVKKLLLNNYDCE